MTPETFRRSPEIIPAQTLRLEKIHPRHAPAFHASLKRSHADLGFIDWGQRLWDAEATRTYCERTRDWIETEGEGVTYLAFEYDTGVYVGCVELHSVDFGVPRARLGYVGCSRQRGQGRMREAGRAQVEAAKADGRWDAAYAPPSRMTVPDDLRAALNADPRAAAAFAALTAGERYSVLYRLHHTPAQRRAGHVARVVSTLTAGPPAG